MEKESKQAEPYNSFLLDLKKKHRVIKLILTVAAVGLLISQYLFPTMTLWPQAVIAGVCRLLLDLREWITAYRIQKGFFGGNHEEAEEIIRFIDEKSAAPDQGRN